MPNDFIERLPVEPPVRESLRTLGYDSPEALSGALEASREAFEAHYGTSVVQQIGRGLQEARGIEPRAHAVPGEKDRYSLGARIERTSAEGLPKTFDVGTRDRLFDELSRLERQSPKTPAIRQRIEELAGRITELVESGNR